MASCSHAVGQPPGRVLGERGDVGAVVRGAQRQHPSYDGRAAVVPHEEPRDHAAGRVADHVDRVGARCAPSSARPGRRAAAPAPAGRPCRPRWAGRRPPPAPRSRSSRDERGEVLVSPPYPGTTITGPGRGLVDAAVARRRAHVRATTTSATTSDAQRHHDPRRRGGQAPVGQRERTAEIGWSAAVSAPAGGRPRRSRRGRARRSAAPRPDHEERRQHDHAIPADEVDVEPVGLGRSARRWRTAR